MEIEDAHKKTSVLKKRKKSDEICPTPFKTHRTKVDDF